MALIAFRIFDFDFFKLCTMNPGRELLPDFSILLIKTLHRISLVAPPQAECRVRYKIFLLVILLICYTSVSYAHSVAEPNPHDSTELSIAKPDLLTEGLLPSTDPVDSVRMIIDKVRGLTEKVRETQNYISNLNDAALFQLPVGIPKLIDGLNYDIIIESIRLKPTHAEADVYMQFEIPQNGKLLTFRGRNIKFTRAGGIVGDAQLQLIGDYGINFSGDKIQLILHGSLAGSAGSYVNIDCDGFQGMSLDAEVKFSRDLLVPEDPTGKILDGNVSATFSASVNNWNDLLVQVNLPAFQIKSLKDFGFTASNIVFDFSDVRNAPAIVFPKGYINTNELPGSTNLWRGLYLRELSVRMPPQFQKKGTTRTELKAQNMIIDNRGVSGFFTATNVIGLKEGDMNGWAFSLDSLAVDLMANELQQAGFDGQILVPVSSENTPFDYTASISGDSDYLFTVAPTENLDFDLWKAKVQIYKGSSLEIKVADKKFLPKAILHGRMNVSAKLGDGESGKGVELADIKFENLQLQAVKPYLKVGNFSFGSEATQQKLAQFPISIQNIGLRSISDTETALDFNLLLNLVGEESGAFAADAGLSLITSLNTGETGFHRWKPKDIEVRSIKIDIDGGAFKFNGSLAFYKQDIVYGNGFNGQVAAEFKPGIKVKASAVFGNVSGMRYWYADAMVDFPSGIPIFSGVGIYGFGGGAYFGMKMDNQGIGSDLGRTASGVVYVPDVKAGLGLKAIVSIGSHPKPEAFNGDVTFEIAFFKGGGVRRIALMGNGYLVTPGLDINVDKLKAATNKMVSVVKTYNAAVSAASGSQLVGEGNTNDLDQIFGSLANAGQKGQISAKVSIDYDFENRVLHGNFEAYVNVAGGIVKGIGSGGRAGWAVLHFAPQEWYVYVGTPDDRIGLSVGIGPIRANATSYMMVGTKILGSPPPPENVTKILGGIDLDYMRDLNALGNGAGFAFGAGFGVDTGDLTFLAFYARFAAGAGFDIMLKDYGDARCKGSSDRLGINGWYANGQAYAYFEGAIGIRVKVFGRRKKIRILEIGAAAVLQAKLPNPFWMRGTVGGYFSVLGGAVSGRCNFQVTLGRECEIMGDDNLLDDIKVISEITPGDGSTEVSVFNAPQGVFNMEINKSFEIIDPEDERPRYFRAKLDHFKVLNGTQEIPATLEWNEKNDVVALNPFDVLPPTKDLKASVQVSFEEKISESWRPVVDDGKVYTENKSAMFKTGVAPDFIPEENILYNYPVSNQLNLYPKESNEGYVQLKTGQPYLFETSDKYDLKARFKSASGKLSTGTLRYNSSERRVYFTIPSDLALNSIYQSELVSVPKQTYKVDQNVKEVAATSSASPETKIRTKQAEGQLDILSEKSMYSVFFRTSQFATFREKVNSIAITSTINQITIPWRIHKLFSTVSGSEYFDLVELRGVQRSSGKPLVQLEAVLADNQYYNQQVYPLVYEGYPIDGNIKILSRDVAHLGFPPVRAMYIDQEPFDFTLSANDVSNGTATMSVSRAFYVYNLPYYFNQDFTDIQAQVVNRYIDHAEPRPRIKEIIFGSLPAIESGYYKYKLKYVLPGTNRVTSEVDITAKY
jgi:hypothetical protein